MLSTLEIVLVFLASAVGVVALARKLHLPPILGYLAAGILVGPHALGFVPDTPGTRYLGEFGVVFLMFSIGLEFNLSKLMAMRGLLMGPNKGDAIGFKKTDLGGLVLYEPNEPPPYLYAPWQVKLVDTESK